MVLFVGLIILVAALIVGVAGVLTNGGGAHALTSGFSVFGYHVTGSTGVLFLYGIVVGALAVFGLSLLLGARAPQLAAGPGRSTRAQALPARDRSGEPGSRRPDRPTRHGPGRHGGQDGERLNRAGRADPRQPSPRPAAPLRAPVLSRAGSRHHPVRPLSRAGPTPDGTIEAVTTR